MKKNIQSVVYVSLILLSVLMAACVDTDTDDDRRMVGTWNWYESSGGIAGIIQTPETTGETRQVVFKRNGRVTFYKNGVVTLISTYTLDTEKTIFSEDPLPVLIVDGTGFIYAYSFPYEDELELKENVYDGFVHKYTKE